MIDYSTLPMHTQRGVKDYIENRIPTGGFLHAVITNDLKEAFGRADDINRDRMFDIVSFFYNQAPINCWGSVKAYDDWIKNEPTNTKTK